MLTQKQQEVFDKMLEIVESKGQYLLSSKNRGIGKTYTLNELAFTLQALGYRVYWLTPSYAIEHYGEKYLSLTYNDYRGSSRENLVVIVDEPYYYMMNDFITYFSDHNVPVVGYVNYKDPNKISSVEFKQEYECKWIK